MDINEKFDKYYLQGINSNENRTWLNYTYIEYIDPLEINSELHKMCCGFFKPDIFFFLKGLSCLKAAQLEFIGTTAMAVLPNKLIE